MLDSLHRLPSEVGLSWWRADSGAAAPGGELCFAYKGRVGAGRVRPVEAISAQRAEQLGAALARWAAAAALSEVRTGSEPVTGVQGGCCRWRRTLWATGTYAQVEEFLGRLAQARPVAAVQELVFGPAAAAAPGAPLYCVVDFFVSRTARP